MNDEQIQEKKRKRNNIGCGPQTSKLLTDKISDQKSSCHVNIVLSVYIEWLSKEVKRTKMNLLLVFPVKNSI